MAYSVGQLEAYLEVIEEAEKALLGVNECLRDEDDDGSRNFTAALQGEEYGWLGGPFFIDQLRSLAERVRGELEERI